jgi:hypothetical protein
VHPARRHPREAQSSPRDQPFLYAPLSADVQHLNWLVLSPSTALRASRDSGPLSGQRLYDGQTGIDVSPGSPTCDPDSHPGGFLPSS